MLNCKAGDGVATTREEQIQQREQILRELQRVEHELQEKAQAQMLLTQQQQQQVGSAGGSNREQGEGSSNPPPPVAAATAVVAAAGTAAAEMGKNEQVREKFLFVHEEVSPFIPLN